MKEKLQTILFASGTILFTALLIKYPQPALESSVKGLNIWWEVVFPSLLPFFVTAELLISFGVVTFIGVLFEPIMRPLFNVSGVGSFAWIMGMASGYPSGAKISARLREENKISKLEAERLLAFTNASSPLFIFGAISVGFFHEPKLGLLIAVCHYLGNTLVGICMKLHGRKITKRRPGQQKEKFTINKAFQVMHDARLQNRRPFGEIFGDAILQSIKTLVMVGGFIILFSVLTELLYLIGLTPFLASILTFLLKILSLPVELALPYLSGLFEITIGAQLIANVGSDSMLAKLMIVSFILGFNGFSVQAQVASIIANTDIRFLPYFIARIFHGIFASILTILLYEPLYKNTDTYEMPMLSSLFESHVWLGLLHWLKDIGPLLTITSLAIGGLLAYRERVRMKQTRA